MKYEGEVTSDTHRTRFGNAARFFTFQKQLNLSITKNFSQYEKQMSVAVEVLQNLQ